MARRLSRAGGALTLIAASILASSSTLLPAPRQEPAAGATAPLTLERVVEMLRAGTPSAEIAAAAAASGTSFELTVDEVVRLRKMGATPELILALASGGTPATGPETPATSGNPAAKGSLTVRQVTHALDKGQPPAEVAAWVTAQGMKEPVELRQILELSERGVPPEVLRAMAAAPPAAPSVSATAAAPGTGAGPLDAAGIIALLDEAASTSEVADAIRARGVSHPLSLDEALSLRQAGADDVVMTAVREATAAPGAATPQAAAPAPEEEADVVAIPARSNSRAALDEPTPSSQDRLWVASVPSGARVFVAAARGRIEEVFEHDHYVGRTPISLPIDPGEYVVVVQKEAGDFEKGLAPAWRTAHDSTATRSLLDDADLTFDPAACCLPGSLAGEAMLRPVPQDVSRTLIGDAFDGLAPWLFDGEALQVLRVRHTHITHSMKLYRLKKFAGRSRMLVSLFLPAEGDPLDQTSVQGLPAGTPYDDWVDAPAIEPLRDPAQLSAFAAALGVEPAQVGSALAMMRRAGKAIVHQPVEGGMRLLALSVEDDGQLRVADRTIRPTDPFAPPPPPAPKKKKKPAPVPPPPPPLPAVQRMVIPGLGLPRLAIENTTKTGLGLMLDDGLMLWVPPGQRREFPVDPGTFEARVVSPLASEAAPGARGRLHFSFNARYALTF